MAKQLQVDRLTVDYQKVSSAISKVENTGQLVFGFLKTTKHSTHTHTHRWSHVNGQRAIKGVKHRTIIIEGRIS